jgi:DNA-binding transcriptional ArsR family regulator
MDVRIQELAKNQADVCRVFGNPNRILMLWALGQGEMTVSEIATAVGCSLQNTSQHLRLMEDRDILTSRRSGNLVYYRVRENSLLVGCRVMSLSEEVR